VETRGGDGRPILAARRSGRRRRVEGKRHAPAEEREGTVRLRGRMLDAQLTVESPRMKSAVAGERDESSAAAAAKWSRTKRRSAAVPAALWREPNRSVGGGVRGEAGMVLPTGKWAQFQSPRLRKSRDHIRDSLFP
jgi:hypothetical protein